MDISLNIRPTLIKEKTKHTILSILQIMATTLIIAIMHVLCGKPGHSARNCRFRKHGPMSQANVTEAPLVAMVTEINILEG